MISLYLMGIVGIEKECIDTTEYSGLGRQRVVDSDCAALFKINNKLFVADHNYQGFWRIRLIVIAWNLLPLCVVTFLSFKY